MAVCFAKHYRVVGFDINRAKIAELKQGRDPIGENGDEAVAASGIAFSHDPVVLRESAFLIICCLLYTSIAIQDGLIIAPASSGALNAPVAGSRWLR